jgi:hypothetical protein
VTVFLQAPNHVGAHSSQPDHAKLHLVCSRFYTKEMVR